jgi:hypothetical protein
MWRRAARSTTDRACGAGRRSTVGSFRAGATLAKVLKVLKVLNV